MKLFQAQALTSLILKEDLSNIKTFAERIGYARTYLYELKNKELSQNFIETIEQKLKIKLTSKSASSELHTKNDGAESDYWELCNSFGDYTKNPKLRTLWGDKEIIKGWWNRRIEDIRCINIFDDKMSGGYDPLNVGDIVAIDTSDSDISKGGIFLFSVEVDNFRTLNIARITILPIEEKIMFSYNNSEKYPPKTYKITELQKVKFKVYARLIHNATHELQ